MDEERDATDGEPGGKDVEHGSMDRSRVAQTGHAKVGGGSARGAPRWVWIGKMVESIRNCRKPHVGVKVQSQYLCFGGIS